MVSQHLIKILQTAKISKLLKEGKMQRQGIPKNAKEIQYLSYFGHNTRKENLEPFVTTGRYVDREVKKANQRNY